jgi:hypothetical protein
MFEKGKPMVETLSPDFILDESRKLRLPSIPGGTESSLRIAMSFEPSFIISLAVVFLISREFKC